MRYSLICSIIFFTGGLLDAQDQAESTSKIQFNVSGDTGQPLPCRIHLQNSRGEPQQAFGQPFWRDHFVCSGRVAVDVAPGTYAWQIERGHEYARQSGTVDVDAGDASVVNVALKRIANLREEGWYSGDLHVHRAVPDIELLMQAEDLDFAPVITWWNTNNLWQDRAVPQQTAITFDRQRVYTVMAGEDERDGGALLYFNLARPLTLPDRRKSAEFPSPLTFVPQARAVNKDAWIDIEKPFWWDVPTWLASGQLNSIGIANNHMCRSQMLANEAWGKPRDLSRLPNPRGNGFWTQEIYYHALNAGIRIPPSAGSASGVLPNPVGYNRVYVQLDPSSSQTPCTAAEADSSRDAPATFRRSDWFAALAGGRCFVTNGPLLRVCAGGKPPGETLELSGATTRTIDLSIQLSSNDPIAELAVIYNGRIVNTIDCSKQTNQQHRVSLTIDQPGWFLVRAIADVDNTFRFASTAPWYVESESVKRGISKPSAQFFADWTDQRIKRVQQSVTNADQARAVLQPHEQARAFWIDRVQQANADLEAAASDIPQTSAMLTALPSVDRVEAQPLLSAVQRLRTAMDYVGSPLPARITAELEKLELTADDGQVTARVQELLDPLCLVGLNLPPTGPPQVTPGNGERTLIEQGWRTFLVKVVNRPGRTRQLLINSPNARPLPHAPAEEVAARWMQIASHDGQPLKPNLSGLALEYRIVQIYSRDPGNKRALLEFNVGDEVDGKDDLIRQWRFDQDADGWFEMHQAEIQVADGALQVTSAGNDPYIGAAVEGASGPLVLRFWAETDADGMGQFFWWTKDRPRPDGQRRTNFMLEPGRRQLYEVPFTVDGELAGIRIDPMSRTGKMRIDWIDLQTAGRSNNWASVPLDFQCRRATQVTFRIQDAYGQPGFARFEIRDADGRVFPTPSKRLAPDFFFHRQIYRGDGESVSLPAGDYTIVCSRGPETIPETKTIRVGADPITVAYRVKRWIDPSTAGWWSGDHHIHAAGCRHYENPTEGVEPADMIRHIMGEDLKVGCCLTWGPCFDYQKRFFTGKVAEHSQYPYLLRYDVEVSGFGSHMSGHLNLLNLQQQIYPGGESKDHWPTLGLNTLRWAKRQGAVCGPAHSSIGLTKFIGRVPGTDGKDGPGGLPNFNVPSYDGIGANEFVVDVTHQVPGPDGKLVPAVDFISTMNTDRTAEWNMWYHVLNCGFRVAASGETDFPCISGDRVGLGRVYAKVDGQLTFAKWIQAIARGRSYVSDASCHLLDFAAQPIGDASGRVDVGTAGSQLTLTKPAEIQLSVQAAARLENAPTVPVELIVNGYPIDSQSLIADGKLQRLTFKTKLSASSWVAVRVFPHAHTNPIYVIVDGKPIRASADSARWCLLGVDQCWQSKQQTYADAEQEDAKAAYDHARQTYQQILAAIEEEEGSEK